MTRVLVVDDEPAVARVIAAMAQGHGHEAVVAHNVASAIDRLSEFTFDVVLSDVKMGHQNGLDLLRHIHENVPEVPVVLITGDATLEAAMLAIRAGAYDYLGKPIRSDAIGALLKRAIEKKALAEENRRIKTEIEAQHRLVDIAGRSPRMLEVFTTVARVADSRVNVLILGENGTGKEMVARTIHAQSARNNQRFVPVNMAAIPEQLVESELFGHVKGAFTGALTARRGLFEEAHLGTLFLDEIGDLSLQVQVKMLRVLQEQVLKPVGGNEEIAVDVRVIAATHRDLPQMVARGQFREDLYFRLNVVSVSLPPLRERAEDIPILAEHFLYKYATETGKPTPRLSPESLQMLEQYDWPGNVRELENVIERAVLLSTYGVITSELISVRPPTTAAAPQPFTTLDEMIQRHVAQVLEFTGGNRTRAAQILGVSRRTLHRMDARRNRASD